MPHSYLQQIFGIVKWTNVLVHSNDKLFTVFLSITAHQLVDLVVVNKIGDQSHIGFDQNNDNQTHAPYLVLLNILKVLGIMLYFSVALK